MILLGLRHPFSPGHPIDQRRAKRRGTGTDLGWTPTGTFGSSRGGGTFVLTTLGPSATTLWGLLGGRRRSDWCC